jgi:hypothetical protein
MITERSVVLERPFEVYSILKTCIKSPSISMNADSPSCTGAAAPVSLDLKSSDFPILVSAHLGPSAPL